MPSHVVDGMMGVVVVVVVNVVVNVVIMTMFSVIVGDCFCWAHVPLGCCGQSSAGLRSAMLLRLAIDGYGIWVSIDTTNVSPLIGQLLLTFFGFY